jgi:hypothetical protein
MNSRTLSKQLRTVADFLDSVPGFENVEYTSVVGEKTSIHFSDKEAFVAAAKAIGPSTKDFSDTGEYATFYLVSNVAPLKLAISRDRVCRKTVKYECEPLFSQDELQTL